MKARAMLAAGLLACAARAGEWSALEAEMRRAARVAEDAICLVVHPDTRRYANGVVLANRRLVVTAFEAFKERTTRPGGRLSVFLEGESGGTAARVLARDEECETLLLELVDTLPGGVQFSEPDEIPVGLPVVLLSHDLGSLRTRARNASFGHVASRLLHADGRGVHRLFVTTIAHRDQQGAPVVDLRGRLLGIAVGAALGGEQTIVVPVDEMRRRFEGEQGLDAHTLPGGRLTAMRSGTGARLARVTEAAFERVRPSVVGVRAAPLVGDPESWDGERDPGPEPIAGSLPAWDRSSGLVVDAAGWVLCPLRVTGWPGAERALAVDLADGTVLPAELVARDTRLRIALLRVEARDLPVPEFAPSEGLAPGSFLCVAGRPNWFPERHVGDLTFGIVSRTGALAHLSRHFDAIQFDAMVSGTNRGGALIDLDGRVRGIVVDPHDTEELSYFERVRGQYAMNNGLGFAIPWEVLQRVLPVLRGGQDLHPPFLGLQVRPVEGGLRVLAIRETTRIGRPTAAASAGIRPGDLLTELGETRLQRHYDLRRALARYDIGDEVAFAWRRDGLPQRASGRLGTR